MCGIAGKLSFEAKQPIAEQEIRQMLAMIRHRGPDQSGIYLDRTAGLGSARLSIIDLHTGQQPIGNEDGRLWIVFNGEIFNYRELRQELDARGHRFTTETDTEVVLHLFEESGPKCLQRLNGQFALAIWDRKDRTLFIARDRVGIRPLYYAERDGVFLFGSEIKAILAARIIRPELDPLALDQVFTFWSTLTPKTIFRGINELPPGHYLTASEHGVQIRRWWELRYPAPEKEKPLEEYLAEFRELLVDSTRIRLRADVPVGAYLSGGLDSSTITAIVSQHSDIRLETFSIAFSDERFDESQHQLRMANHLGTQHHVVFATHADIARVFPDVIWHTEVPLLRTAPAPMFLLSRLVHDHQFKVVLTGEGADEILAGYDIFKEARIRSFWARQPGSQRRPLLFQRLYPEIVELAQSNPTFLAAFFGEDLCNVDAFDYSHSIRWRNTGRTRRFFSDELGQAITRELRGQKHSVYRPAAFDDWSVLERAQFLESSIFLPQYLLSSQGDRMGMAHSVEGRFPFLDYRVVEFCNRLPSNLKLRGLTEKYLLRKLAADLVPADISQRRKRPYRAPIHRSFFAENGADYVRELLSPSAIRSTGLFKPGAVGQLVRKIENGLPIGETDEMALAGVLSTQLLHHRFISCFNMPPPLSSRDDVRLLDLQNDQQGDSHQ